LKILSKIFWRWILPVLLGFSLAFAWMLEFTGRGAGFRGEIGPYVNALLFVGCLGFNLWKTLPWAKEAEAFETNLKEADAIERERRRRSAWIER